MSKQEKRYVVGYYNDSRLLWGSNEDSRCIFSMNLEGAKEAIKEFPNQNGTIYELVEHKEEKPNLELATTRQLLDELITRVDYQEKNHGEN